MKQTILFVILDQYADWESAYLSTALTELSMGEIDVKTVSLSTNPLKTIGGFTTLPDYDIHSSPKDALGLVLIGGKTWKDPNAISFLPLIQDALDRDTIVAAICGASEFLGAFGFLNHIKHTSNSIESIMSWENHQYNNAENYMDEQSIRDGNIITANGTASLDFARDVLHALSIFDEQKIEEWYAFHKIGYIDMMRNFSK